MKLQLRIAGRAHAEDHEQQPQRIDVLLIMLRSSVPSPACIRA